MKKLEDLHKKAIYSGYYIENCARDSVIVYSEKTAIDKATEITTDVAVKFAKFCWDDCYFFHKEYKWKIGDAKYSGKMFTSDELFDIFINDYYNSK